MPCLAASFSSLPSEEPGPPKLLAPLEIPQEDAPGCKASSSISVPGYSLGTCPACPGAANSRKPYGCREVGESGPLAPVSIVLDENPGHSDPAGRTSDRRGGKVSGMPSECDSQVQPGPREPRPRGFVDTGEWPGLVAISEEDRPCRPVSNVKPSLPVSITTIAVFAEHQ